MISAARSSRSLFCLAIRFRPLSFISLFPNKKIVCASFQLTQTILHSLIKPFRVFRVFRGSFCRFWYILKRSLPQGKLLFLSTISEPSIAPARSQRGSCSIQSRHTLTLLLFKNSSLYFSCVPSRDSGSLVHFLSFPFRPACRYSRQRVFRPVMLRIPTSQFLAHRKIAVPPKAGQVARHLHRPLRRG